MHYIAPYETYRVKNICLHIFRCFDIVYTQYWLIFTGLKALSVYEFYKFMSFISLWALSVYELYKFMSLEYKRREFWEIHVKNTAKIPYIYYSNYIKFQPNQ